MNRQSERLTTGYAAISLPSIMPRIKKIQTTNLSPTIWETALTVRSLNIFQRLAWMENILCLPAAYMAIMKIFTNLTKLKMDGRKQGLSKEILTAIIMKGH